MSDENNRGEGSEDQFFTAKPREESFVGRVGPPPPVGPKIAAGVAAAVVLAGLAYWQLRTPPVGLLWVMNPGPTPALVYIDGAEPEVAPPGRVTDRRARVGGRVSVSIQKPGPTENLEVELDPQDQGVTLIDVGGEAGYIVLDVSAHFGEAPEPARLPVTHVSAPAKVHKIPIGALKLVRPGQPLPNPGSWELQAFRVPSKPLEIHKVFRVDPRRLQDRDALVEQLSEAVRTGHAVDFENTRFVVTSTRTVDGVIPTSEDR